MELCCDKLKPVVFFLQAEDGIRDAQESRGLVDVYKRQGQAFDNLPELLTLIIKQDDVRITLVEGADWMMCAPCPSWTKENYCVHSLGKCGLSNQLRDMRAVSYTHLTLPTTYSA